MAENRPRLVASIGRYSRAPSWGGRLGSIPDEEGDESMEFMEPDGTIAEGDESSGGGVAGTRGEAHRHSYSNSQFLSGCGDAVGIVEDSVGGGSRSTRTRSPSPSVAGGAGICGGGSIGGGGGSRTASGVEGPALAATAAAAVAASAGVSQNPPLFPPLHPTSSGGAGGGGGIGGFGSVPPRAQMPPGGVARHQQQQLHQQNFHVLSPLSHAGRWDSYFDSKRKISVPERGARFVVYQRGGGTNNAEGTGNVNGDYGGDTAISSPPPASNNGSGCGDPVVFCHHGAGYTGLSWALMAAQMGPGVRVVAYDARGHGETETDDDADLSAATQAKDAAALWRTLFSEEIAEGKPPKTVAVGHAMGGMACVRAAAQCNGYGGVCGRNGTNGGLVGIVLVDVVLWHGGAAESAPHMMSVIAGRPPEFPSFAAAMHYSTSSGRCRNPEAAAVSFVSMIKEETDEHGTRWRWRTPLERSCVKDQWSGWYDGLIDCLLSPALGGGCAKLLLFSSTATAARPLDRALEVARAQGKLQVLELPFGGYAVHEDEPGATAAAVRDFLDYNARGSGGCGLGGDGGCIKRDAAPSTMQHQQRTSGGGGESSGGGGSRTNLAGLSSG